MRLIHKVDEIEKELRKLLGILSETGNPGELESLVGAIAQLKTFYNVSSATTCTIRIPDEA